MVNQQPRQGGGWQPLGNQGQNSNWGAVKPSSNWGVPQEAPGVEPGSTGNGGQWGGASAQMQAAGSAVAEKKPSTEEMTGRSGVNKKQAPLAAWPVAAQVALALVLGAFALFAFSYLQDRAFGNLQEAAAAYLGDAAAGVGQVVSYNVLIQFGLYAGLGLVLIVIRWLSSDTRPFLWAASLAVLWMSVFFLRLNNRPWMLGILLLLAGIVFPIGLLFLGIIADFSGTKLGRAGAYFLSLLVPLVVFAVFALLYYIGTGQSSGEQEISVPWLAPWFEAAKDLSFTAELGQYPLGQLLAFIFVASIYIPVASSRSVSDD